LGISIIHTLQVLTDNGPCFYRLQFRSACQAMGIKHRRTRPYRPQTNGKAERFIETAIRKWAYARRYETSARRLNISSPGLTSTTGIDHMLPHQPSISRCQLPVETPQLE
jgi:transposase InsO family protein